MIVRDQIRLLGCKNILKTTWICFSLASMQDVSGCAINIVNRGMNYKAALIESTVQLFRGGARACKYSTTL